MLWCVHVIATLSHWIEALNLKIMYMHLFLATCKVCKSSVLYQVVAWYSEYPPPPHLAGIINTKDSMPGACSFSAEAFLTLTHSRSQAAERLLLGYYTPASPAAEASLHITHAFVVCDFTVVSACMLLTFTNSSLPSSAWYYDSLFLRLWQTVAVLPDVL